MRKDTTFLDRKLSQEEFTKKYWLNGDAPYQYHEANIEDGRDEREQFILNNIRALRGQIVFYNKHGAPQQNSKLARVNRSIKKTTALAVTSTVIGISALVIAFLSYLK